MTESKSDQADQLILEQVVKEFSLITADSAKENVVVGSTASSVPQVSLSQNVLQDRILILNEVNLQLAKGATAAITGPSGSGKSTLLSILGTLDQPTSGSVSLFGTNPLTLNEKNLALFRNQMIGLIFQDHYLLPQCSVLENVLLPTLASSDRDPAKVDEARQLLKRTGLSTRLNHRPAQLSGGERQRVAVCRALIHRPSLLLADEPTGNLDPASSQNIGSLLLEMSDEYQTTLICVTHSQQLAARFSQQFELDNGKLIKTN